MAITPDALLEFARTIATQSGTKSGQKLAKVTRIEDGVTYVSLPGGVDETPIDTTGAVLGIGDEILVSVESGRLRAHTNISNPSVSRRVVASAASALEKTVAAVQKATDEAARVANAVNQYFWHDTNGVHVTEVENDATTEHNILINSLGILLRKATNYLVAITESAVAFYDGTGNNASNVTASFGSSSAVIGKADELQLKMTAGAMALENDADDTVFQVAENASTTITTSAELVTFADSSEVDTTALSVSNSLTASGDTTVTLTTGGSDYVLDSTYATVTVTAGTGVSVALTSDGVTYVAGLLDESGESGTLYVEYEATHYDEAALDMVGAVSVIGEGRIVAIENQDWSSSNSTDTFFSAYNSVSDKMVKFGVGSGGINRGVWDSSLSKWLIHSGASKVYLNGGKIIVRDDGFQRNGGFVLVSKNSDTSQSSIKNWRFAFTDYGNLRLDKSTNGTTWTTVDFFVKTADLGSLAYQSSLNALVVSNSDTSQSSVDYWRSVLTDYGNLRLDKSTDNGSTWTTVTYFAKQSDTVVAATDTTVTSSAVSIAANSGSSISLTLSVPSGYEFGSIQQVTTNHMLACHMTGFTRSGTTVTGYFYNISSSAQSTTMTVSVHWLKKTIG